MIDTYLALRLVHILSATVLFGTGLGTAYFMWRADRCGDLAVITVTARHVVQADWLFTLPAIVVQFVTGLGLTFVAGYGLTEPWILAAILLFLLAGACWLPVVWLQIRLRDMAEASRRAG